MRTISAFLAALLTLTGYQVPAAEQISHYVILVDDSSSNPLVIDTTHARRVAEDMAREITGFKMRDRITITPLGRFGGNPILETEVNKRLPPEQAMQSVKAMISEFPEAVKTVLGGPAPVTHIQGALQLVSSRVDCTKAKTFVFVLSDGRETGDQLRIQPSFQGCEALTMIGVIGDTPIETANIGASWKQWCEGAGFRHCKIIN